MAVTAGDVLAEVNADDSHADLADRVLASANALVQEYLDEAVRVDPETGTPVTVPSVILDDAVRTCAVDLFNRAKAPNGVLLQQYDDDGTGSTAIRVARDPLLAVRPILAQWCRQVWVAS